MMFSTLTFIFSSYKTKRKDVTLSIIRRYEGGPDGPGVNFIS